MPDGRKVTSGGREVVPDGRRIEEHCRTTEGELPKAKNGAAPGGREATPD